MSHPNVTRTLTAADGTEIVLRLHGSDFTINGHRFTSAALYELAEVTEWMADAMQEKQQTEQAVIRRIYEEDQP